MGINTFSYLVGSLEKLLRLGKGKEKKRMSSSKVDGLRYSEDGAQLEDLKDQDRPKTDPRFNGHKSL